MLEQCAAGCALNEIDGVVVSKLQAELKEYQELLQPILKAIEITMRSAEKVQVHMSGAKNMLAFPEFSDIQKAKSLIQTLEEKDQLVTMLKESSGNDIQIMIGSENSVQGMQDCSVITATYKMGDNTRGTIGIGRPNPNGLFTGYFRIEWNGAEH